MLTEAQQKKAIELLKEASEILDVMRFELGEDSDENNIEGDINNFLEEIKGK